MGRYTAESTGMDVLRPIAAQQLKRNPEKKKRVWSEDLEAWGFFAEDEVTKNDVFLLWCSVTPGDRLVLKLDEENEPQVSTIVGIWKEPNTQEATWTYRLIDQLGRLAKIDVNEKNQLNHNNKIIINMNILSRNKIN